MITKNLKKLYQILLKNEFCVYARKIKINKLIQNQIEVSIFFKIEIIYFSFQIIGKIILIELKIIYKTKLIKGKFLIIKNYKE